MGIVEMFRDRASIEGDLRAGLHSLARLADAIDHRTITTADITGADATADGLKRLCTEWRASRRPPEAA